MTVATEWQTSSIDPFLGKCIHGTPGAKWVDGKLVNPDCEHCKRLEEERNG